MTKPITRDILVNISTFSSPEDVANASVVCKIWNRALNQRMVWKKQCEIQENTPCCVVVRNFFKKNVKGINSHILSVIAGYDEERGCDYREVFKRKIPNAITPEVYETHFRDVKVIDPQPRPATMRKENNKSDPEKPHLTIGQTHIWTYLPELQINGKEVIFSIDLLKKLTEKPRKGFPAKFNYDHAQVSSEQSKASIGNAGWYLMPDYLIRKTEGLSFKKQKKIVTAQGYEIPSGPDVILTALLWRVLTGEYFWQKSITRYTRTSTPNADGEGHWTFGYDDCGLSITDQLYFYHENEDLLDRIGCGLTGIKKFS